MRFATAALAALLPLAPSNPPLEADAPEGLRLEAAAEATAVDAGYPIAITVRLVNRSKTLTHPVVRSNDGSEVGWREPHVFWTATWVEADDRETPIEPRGLGRCGLYSADWTKDVTRLAPGESIDVEWMSHVHHAFDLQKEGLVRITAHYVWRGGKAKGLPPGTKSTDFGLMTGVPPYELRSNPVDVRIVRQLDVVAETRAEARSAARRGSPISSGSASRTDRYRSAGSRHPPSGSTSFASRRPGRRVPRPSP
jgi:hypothetical protein